MTFLWISEDGKYRVIPRRRGLPFGLYCNGKYVASYETLDLAIADARFDAGRDA